MTSVDLTSASVLPVDGAVQKFLDHLRFERFFSDHTLKAYRADIEGFCIYLFNASGKTVDGEYALLNSSLESVQGYLTLLTERGNTASTLARRIAAFKSFFKFANKQELTANNPAKLLKWPKFERQVPKFATQDQVEALLKVNGKGDILAVRDKAMFHVIYAAGLRVNELVRLDLTDVDFVSQTVTVRKNGNKERIVSIGPATDALKHYLKSSNRLSTVDPSTDRPLFVNCFGGRLSMRSVRRCIRRRLKVAGLDPNISPNTLRNTFAAQSLKNGERPTEVKEKLGLRSVQSTLRYAV